MVMCFMCLVYPYQLSLPYCSLELLDYCVSDVVCMCLESHHWVCEVSMPIRPLWSWHRVAIEGMAGGLAASCLSLWSLLPDCATAGDALLHQTKTTLKCAVGVLSVCRCHISSLAHYSLQGHQQPAGRTGCHHLKASSVVCILYISALASPIIAPSSANDSIINKSTVTY